MYSLRNRPEKLAKGSLFCLFLKLVQINFIFTDNVRILYICFYSLILLVSGEAANTKFYSLWFDSGLNPGLSVLQWIETRTYRSRVDWTQDLSFSSGLNPGLTVLEWIEPMTYCARVDWTQDLLCLRWKCYQLHHWGG